MDNDTLNEEFNQILNSYENNLNKFNYMSLKGINNKNDFYADTNYVYNNLKNGIIYLNNPLNFLDKKEMKLCFDYKDWEPFFEIIQIGKNENDLMKNNYDLSCMKEKIVETVLKELEHANNEMIGMMGVFCLAPSCNLKFFWENYADNFNGICCEFSERDLDEDKLAKLNISKRKVLYINEKIKFTPEHLDPNKVNYYVPDSLKEKICTKYNETNELFSKLFAVKKFEYVYELENRLIKIINNDEERKIMMKPSKVYIGYNVSKEVRECLIKLLDENEIEYCIVNPNDIIDYKFDFQKQRIYFRK